MPGRHALTGSAAAIAVALLAAPAGAFFGGSDPGEDAPFIESLEAGRWTPSIVDGSAVAERPQSRSSDLGSRFDQEVAGGAIPTASETGNVVVGERANAYIDGMTAARLDSRGIVPFPAFEAYLEGIAERLVAHSPITGVPYDIKVIGSQNLGDAAAYPDGVIVVPIGLLAHADTEDEIAGLLAHELTHVIVNHHDADWLDRTNTQLVSAAEVGAGMLFDLGKQMGVIQEGDARREVLIGYAATQATMFLTGTVLTPDWTREQELEADMMAVDLAVAAGYSPEAYFDLLDKVVAQETLMPTKEERVAQLRAEVDARAGQRMRQGLQEGDSVDLAIGLLEKGAFELDQAFAPLRDSHPTTEERIELLLEYYERHYFDDPDVNTIPSSGSLVALRQDPVVREVLANYLAAWEAKQLADGSPEAERLARQSISGPTENHALPRLAFAAVRGAQGEQRKERLNLTYAMQGPEPNYLIYQRAIVFDLQAGDRESAFALIDEAWDRFNQPPGLYPFEIFASLIQGDRQRAVALNRECRLYFRNNARICNEALEGNLERLIDPGPGTYVPPPSPTGLPSDGGAAPSGSAGAQNSGSGFAPAMFGGQPSSGSGSGTGSGGFLGGLLNNLPSHTPEGGGTNSFEDGSAIGSHR
jgi:Zn-dependent protease with chaperone function